MKDKKPETDTEREQAMQAFEKKWMPKAWEKFHNKPKNP